MKKTEKMFDLLNLQALEIIFKNLEHDTNCNEVRIYHDKEPHIIGVEPIKILEHVNSKIKDKYGAYKIRDILEDYFFDYYLNNKKAKALKNKEIESIDISKNFIRFNLKEV